MKYPLFNRYLDILCLSFLWAPSAVCMKILTNQIPPLTLVACCSILAAFCTLLYLKFKKIHITHYPWNLWRHAFIIGFFGHALPFTLLCSSVYYMQSIWTGLITALVPLFTVLLAHFFLPNEKLSLLKLLGILLGLTGTLILMYESFSDPSGHKVIGVTLGLFAASSLACALILAKRFEVKAPPMVRSCLHILTATFYLVPLALVIDHPWTLCCINPSIITAILILAIPGTMLAFIFYYRILNHSGATAVSVVNYILPFLKAILGIIYLHETMNLHFALATLLILSGIFLVNRKLYH